MVVIHTVILSKLIILLKHYFWAEFEKRKREMCLSIITMVLIIANDSLKMADVIFCWTGSKIDNGDGTNKILMENLIYSMNDSLIPFLLVVTLCFRSTRDVLQDISKLDNLIKVSIF